MCISCVHTHSERTCVSNTITNQVIRQIHCAPGVRKKPRGKNGYQKKTRSLLFTTILTLLCWHWRGPPIAASHEHHHIVEDCFCCGVLLCFFVHESCILGPKYFCFKGVKKSQKTCDFSVIFAPETCDFWKGLVAAAWRTLYLYCTAALPVLYSCTAWTWRLAVRLYRYLYGYGAWPVPPSCENILKR